MNCVWRGLLGISFLKQSIPIWISHYWDLICGMMIKRQADSSSLRKHINLWVNILKKYVLFQIEIEAYDLEGIFYPFILSSPHLISSLALYFIYYLTILNFINHSIAFLSISSFGFLIARPPWKLSFRCLGNFSAPS